MYIFSGPKDTHLQCIGGLIETQVHAQLYMYVKNVSISATEIPLYKTTIINENENGER